MKIKVTYNIYKLRQEKGLTIRDLSKISGVSRSQINNIENGTNHATVPILCMIAEALQVSPSELYQYRIM